MLYFVDIHENIDRQP